MRGTAKHFNTLADIANSMAVDAEGTKKRLRALWEGRFIWQDTGALDDGARGIVDETHKVMELSDHNDPDKIERHQFVLVEDKNAWAFQIGLTAAKYAELMGE